ncbi:MAG: hypothetical protein KGY60_02985 [Bacteroidales bacterium]|nr:hypothetical protein [Bacteroidales bacterium]
MVVRNWAHGIFWLFVTILFAGLLSCEEERFVDDPEARLSFSTDTVLFDTVFTTIGSTTKRFTVENPHDKKIRISSIELAGGKDSDYRLNINGLQSHRVQDIELDARDSLFIFVEVTIDPTQVNQPMVVKDSVVFTRESRKQDVKLISWGQDVHLIRGEVLGTQTWTSDKPYLIYNSALVDTGSTLTVEAGTQVHFHKNSRFYVAGTLLSEGTIEDPVVFQGDRLEKDYSDIPGQWDGIWLMAGSTDNRIRHTTIKNAIIGLQVDTLASTQQPTLRLSHSRIMHMTYAGILARGSTIKADNTIVADCAAHTLALTLGGSYEFYHCTFANYWSGSTRNTPSVFLNNYYLDSSENTQIRGLEKARFTNCIIYGNRIKEIGFDFQPAGPSNYFFSHCLIRNNPEDPLPAGKTENLLVNKDPLFVSIPEDNFRLDTLSPAIDQGEIATGNAFPTDIINNSRTADEAPDLGAFEYIPGTGSREE